MQEKVGVSIYLIHILAVLVALAPLFPLPFPVAPITSYTFNQNMIASALISHS